MAQTETKTPPAKSLIYGLRCIGYDFSTALADIIDNSVSAFAKNIFVLSNPDDDPYVAIFDDGIGMGKKELDNAMTLGSDRSEKTDNDIELGRFGLGLKSASFSQCLKLIVATKKTNKINAMRYDLRKIQDSDKWLIDILDDDEINMLPEIEKLKSSKTGTLVIWQDFDKIAEGAKQFNESFINTIGMAKKHIEFVFHRFSDDINFEFNGHPIEKRDPFLSKYACSQKGRTQIIKVDGQPIEVTPYVLPYAKMLNEEHKKMLGNPKSIYDEQGLYIYRNKRLIIWGSWLRMNVRSEFNKLARVCVDMPSSLDSVWMLDVKKSSAKIPDKIKEQLAISIKDSIVRSKREIKYPGKKESEVEKPIWSRIDLHGGNIKYEINRESNPLYNTLKMTLDNDQCKLLDAYLDKVEECIPKGLIVSDHADSLNILNSTDSIEEEKLIDEIVDFSKHCIGGIETFVNMMLSGQPYAKVADKKKIIIERIKKND